MSQVTRLAVRGLSCGGCVASVEKALAAVPGVASATVSLAERSAVVEGDAQTTELITAIQGAGFDASVLRDAADEREREAAEAAEYRAMWRRAAVAGVFGAVLMFAAMSGLLPSLDQRTPVWMVISLATLIVMASSGGHFFRGAWQTLKAGRGNMDTLVALGTGTAWLYSTAVVLMPDVLPSVARHAYFEAALIIIALVSVGSVLEMRARRRTSAAIRELMQLQPDTVLVIRDGAEQEIPLAQVGLDETIRVRPGMRIPVDGVVFDGESHINESMLTGEPMPVHKGADDEVFAGTLNTSGSFLMTSRRIGADTMLAQIVDMVRSAQADKTEVGRMVDRVAAVFVPIVVAIAALSFVAWLMLGPDPALGYAVVAAMTVLIIACPCALGLATPISIMVAVGRAAEQGILIRNGDALQRLERVTTVVFDKTGTVTCGAPEVTALWPESGVAEDELLGLAAAVEQYSEHPLARAVLSAATERGLALAEVTDFRAQAGFGVSGHVAGTPVHVGKAAYLATQGIEVGQGQNGTGTRLFVARGVQALGAIEVADPAREDSAAAVRQLHDLGVRVLLVTGDSQATAQAIAAEIGIDEVIAEVLPADKALQVSQLQASGEIVAMVGDGINDAPALARADAGIAMRSGTDVAIESADVMLMRDSIAGVAESIRLARATVRNMRQNLFGAFAYNTLAIPVAAGVLYPIFGVLLNPMVGAAAMSLSSLTVVTNALRLRKV